MAVSLRNMLFSNLRAKLMALVMAVVVWFYAYHFSQGTMSNVSVPLIIETPPGWILVGCSLPSGSHEEMPLESTEELARGEAQSRVGEVLIKEMTFRTGAADRVAEALRRHEMSVHYSLAAGGQDLVEKSITLEPRHFRLPAGADVRVIDFRPRTLHVTMAREATQWKPVELQIGKLPEGYELESVTTWPQEVEVRGPKFVLDRIQSILTKPVVITRVPPTPRIGPNDQQIQPFVTLDGKRYPVKTVESVSFWINLRAEQKSRKFTGIPIWLTYSPHFQHVASIVGEKVVTVIAKGMEADLAQLRAEDIRVWAEINENVEPGELPYNQSLQWSVRGTHGKGITLELDKDVVKIEVKPKPK